MTKKKEGIFSAELNLPKESQHEFRYFLDKKIWLNDEQADAEKANIFGTTNSVLSI
jgi:hypothetical protein